MTDRGIMFSAPMVRALLAGRKTQTRRLASSPLTRVAAGDRLYVREAWRTLHKWDDVRAGQVMDDRSKITYEADPERRNPLWAFGRLRASMHMPRFASRMTLVVESTRAEPLQAISERDAKAEGLEQGYVGGLLPAYRGSAELEWRIWANDAYAALWDSLRPAEGQRWRDNPDVLVLTFAVHHTNIDQL